MSYMTISHWRASEWGDVLGDTARKKYIPLVMKLGAESIDLVRTGDPTYCVIVKYADQTTAEEVQAEIAEIRAQAADDLPTEMTGLYSGPVFASN